MLLFNSQVFGAQRPLETIRMNNKTYYARVEELNFSSECSTADSQLYKGSEERPRKHKLLQSNHTDYYNVANPGTDPQDTIGIELNIGECLKLLK